MCLRVFLTLIVTLSVSSCSENRPVELGCVDGWLFRCPASPNCVSSQSADEGHYIKPFMYRGALEEARTALLSAIGELPRSEIVTVKPDYVHATFTSRWLRFVDDVEFCFDENSSVIHVRSASRLGYYDFGVNRRRVETIRAMLSNSSNSPQF